ncbi:condensation domain-containing protein [Streptomyces griseus]|uniref:condensation domain-containing protein n=1 Tax=Streptomyces griseus TaxID=1911 RepID=UPI0033D92987
MVPVTSAQRGMRVAPAMRPDDTGDVWGAVLVVDGDLSAVRLERALRVLRGRHDALRTVFPESDGGVLQVVRSEEEAAAQQPLMDIIEAEGDSPDERREWADAEARKLLDVPFNLSSGPLWRASVIRISPTLHLLILVFHHIITKDISAQIFAGELRLAYADPKAPASEVRAAQGSELFPAENTKEGGGDGLD